MKTYVLVGTRKGAWIYSSEDRETWELSEPIMPGWTVYHMAVDARRDPVRIYAAANHWAWGRSVARSDDGGKTWERRSPGLGFAPDSGLAVENTWHIEPGHPDRPGQVWVGTQPAGLFRSDDWGESWTGVDSLNNHPYRQFWGPAGGAGAAALHSIQIDPRNPDRIYISISTGGTMVSEDAGQTWELCSHGIVATTPAAKQFLAEIADLFPQPELPPDVDPAALDEFHKFRIDPKNPDRLWGQSHVGVFRSNARGKDWLDVTNNLPSFHGFPLAVTKREPDAVFVLPLEFGQDNFRVQPGQLAVWRTMNGGESWEALTNGLPGPHNYQSAYREALDTDGNSPEGVYLGTTNGEVFGSANLGERWQRLPGTLPPILSVTAAAW